jgi:hypothetical protein
MIVSQDRNVEIGLALEISVQRPLGDAGFLRHFVEIRTHESVAKKDIPGGFKDAPTTLSLFFIS